MKTYNVKIAEKYKQTLTIEAESVDSAKAIILDHINRGILVPNKDNCVNRHITVTAVSSDSEENLTKIDALFEKYETSKAKLDNTLKEIEELLQKLSSNKPISVNETLDEFI